MQQFEVKVINKIGLHARPAAMFVKTANQFQPPIRLRNFTGASDWVDAKGLLGILTLGVEQDHVIEVEVDGNDEIEAATTLRTLVEDDFPLPAE
jgi:phosphotransferase system HPr (HPr) family protein